MIHIKPRELIYTNPCRFCGLSHSEIISIDLKKLNTVSKRDKFRKKLKKELIKEHYLICEQARRHFSTERMRGLCD